jgi:hypothetical protein
MDVRGADIKRQSLNGPTNIKKKQVYNDFIRRFERKSEPLNLGGQSKLISASSSQIKAQVGSKPLPGTATIEINPKMGLNKTGVSPARLGRGKKVKADTEPGFGMHMYPTKREAVKEVVDRRLADLDRRISFENDQLAILKQLEEEQKVDLLSINANRGALVSKEDKTNILLKMENLKRKYLDQALSIVQEHNLHKSSVERRRQGTLFAGTSKEKLDHTAFWRDSPVKTDPNVAVTGKLSAVQLPVLRRTNGEVASSGKRTTKSSNHSEINYSRLGSRSKKELQWNSGLYPRTPLVKQPGQPSIEGTPIPHESPVFLAQYKSNK